MTVHCASDKAAAGLYSVYAIYTQWRKYTGSANTHSYIYTMLHKLYTVFKANMLE